MTMIKNDSKPNPKKFSCHLIEYSTDEKFSVKSCYKMLSNNTREDLVNGRIVSSKIWKALWQTKVVHRVKMFAWKCIHGIHSTRVRLALYNSDMDIQRGSCGMLAETMEHFSWACEHSKAVWKLLNINIEAITAHYNSVSKWVEDWVSRWISPALDYLKINIDASFDRDTNQAGTGIVIRDHTCTCTGIEGSYSDGVLSAEPAECMAVLEALQWAKELHLNKVHIESDARLVIQSLVEDNLLIQWENRSTLKAIEHLSLSFSGCHFSFTNRNNNNVAASIARTV
ncbi:uncharacterized protein LOC113353261 [Papaver somniferum]|uniref:uncharacterized protein LOC113353261 n=1 Tax=Papaver somniferum TaxID=3469 RepID=UPI000E6FEBF0|nr:uncharacterized protein LOC113353261 [Papaver somniferum]